MSLSIIALPIIFVVLKIAAIASLGWILSKKSILHDSATADLGELVVKVAVPCLVFSNAARGFAGVSGLTAAIVIASGPTVLGVGYLFSITLERLFGIATPYRKAVVAASTFQNSAYLPLAVASTVAVVATSALGVPASTAAKASSAAILYISLFNVIYSPIFWGIGLSWIANAKPFPAGASGRNVLPILIRLIPPPVVGLMAGYTVGLTPLHLLLTPDGAPLGFLFSAIIDVGNLTVPVAVLMLGAMLARAGTGEREPLKNHLIVIATRFLFVPGVFLTGLWMSRGYWTHTTSAAIAAFVMFLESVTPPATNLAVMAKRGEAGNALREELDDRTSRAIPRILLVTYVLTMLVMPLWLLLFMRMMGEK